MHRVRVCIADDHIALRDRAVQQLAHAFDVVGVVGDGQALLDAAAALDPDVVILDISMPVLDGIEAAKRLQESGCRAKIVFLTVHDDADFARAALGTGALGYVVKPRLVSDLIVAINEALAGRTFVSPSDALGNLCQP